MNAADRLRAILAEATPGPWAWHGSEASDSPGTLYNTESLERFLAWLQQHDLNQPAPDLTPVLDAYGDAIDHGGPALLRLSYADARRLHTEGYVGTSPGNARLIALDPDLAAWAADAAELVAIYAESVRGKTRTRQEGMRYRHLFNVLARLDRIVEEEP